MQFTLFRSTKKYPCRGASVTQMYSPNTFLTMGHYGSRSGFLTDALEAVTNTYRINTYVMNMYTICKSWNCMTFVFNSQSSMSNNPIKCIFQLLTYINRYNSMLIHQIHIHSFNSFSAGNQTLRNKKENQSKIFILNFWCFDCHKEKKQW